MGKLARPRWRVGQVLHPRHLLALEEALSAEAARRAAAAGLPVYGLTTLDWNGEDPQGGVLFVEGLSAVFPGGMVIDVPDNAKVRAPLDLKSAGKRTVEVFLHVVDPPEDDAEEEDDPWSAASAAGEDVVRREHTLDLSASPVLVGSRDRLPLGRFTLDDKGRYRLDEEALPPLLRVDASAALARRLTRVRGELAALERKLDTLAADAVGQGRPLAPMQRVRIEARKLDALLDDLAGDVKARRPAVPLHPYPVFSALRAFSSELAVLDETKAPGKLPAYDHDHPSPSFSAVLGSISEWIGWSPPGSPRVPFVLDGGRLVATLPDDALAASEVYVVVLKREDGDVVPFDRVRLASPRRLSLVREFSIRGVPSARDAAPRFRYGFGAGAEFYRLEAVAAPPGEEPREWDHVIRERAIAFHPLSQLEGLRFVLCWRRP